MNVGTMQRRFKLAIACTVQAPTKNSQLTLWYWKYTLCAAPDAFEDICEAIDRELVQQVFLCVLEDQHIFIECARRLYKAAVSEAESTSQYMYQLNYGFEQFMGFTRERKLINRERKLC